jgi:type IX secretion system PorP/SprF family membrane protein
MDIKTNMPVIERALLLLVFVFTFVLSEGQQTPLNPLSYWVYAPYIYNPAIVGSKDFISIDLNASFQGKSQTQIISGNTRISKTQTGYFSSPDIFEFKNIGIGGSVFHDINGPSRNFGFSAAGSYQIPLNTRNLSFLSVGASVKGVYNLLDSGSVEPGNPLKKTFYPNLDLGVYYYGTNFYTGISTTNLLGNPEKPDSHGLYTIPVSRQYFFTAGYKILLSKSLNFVVEPSVLINADDSTIKEIKDDISPILKIYLADFCMGTYFLSNGKTSFFFQYRYPKFYIGAFYELPKKSPYYKRTPFVEFTLGLNIQSDKSRLSTHSRW